MHLETLLYMLLQSEWVLPPPEPKPDFGALAAETRKRGNEAFWIKIPDCTLKLGLDDPENDKGPDRFFGWDNEKPSRLTHVHAFEASTRAITNGEYAKYLDACGVKQWPASWIVDEPPYGTNGVNGSAHSGANGTSGAVAFTQGKSVRTIYGPVPLEHALDWPMMASYNELAGCARWMGGRIPTREEAQSIYEYVESRDREAALSDVKNARTIPAVNG
jgi:L-histidine Nalpha-methyltransferase / hercynylcysteine S-oxide synthase